MESFKIYCPRAFQNPPTFFFFYVISTMTDHVEVSIQKLFLGHGGTYIRGFPGKRSEMFEKYFLHLCQPDILLARKYEHR